MSSALLKIIAVVTMVVDHVGYMFFPQYSVFRYIGRLSMPIFCFLLAEGFTHTRSVKKYALRLALFAVISEVPYDYFLSQRFVYWSSQNIMFTLLLSLGALYCVQKAQQRQYIWALSVPVAMVLAQVLNFSYGFYGVLITVGYYLLRDRGYAVKLLAAVMLILSTLLYDYYHFRSFDATQTYAVFATIPIFLYSGKKGFRLPKYFAYAFYPAHLLALSVVFALWR